MNFILKPIVTEFQNASNVQETINLQVALDWLIFQNFVEDTIDTNVILTSKN